MTSYPLKSLENTTMATLIDSITRCWNEELVDGLFAPSEAVGATGKHALAEWTVTEKNGVAT